MKSFLSFLITLVAINTNLFAAEAGMPQLDPTYWASQAFWLILVFTILYISISKFYLPKIKDNLDNRENKIKEDLENANKFKEQSEAKVKEYAIILENAKKEVSKIHFESKNILDKAVYGLEFDAPGGKKAMHPTNQHTLKPVYIGEILRNGQFKIVYASDGLVSPDSYSSYLWPDGNFPKPTGGPNGDGSL